MLKLLIAGSRSIKCKTKVQLIITDYVNELIERGPLRSISDLLIVTGGAKGVDAYAEEWARTHGVPNLIWHANWYPHTYGGKKDPDAGYKRNIKMGEASDKLLAFWDTKSNGTDHMVQYMSAEDKEVRLVIIDDEL